MKKILILCVAALAGLLAVSSCKKIKTDSDFVVVTGVTLDQDEISLVKGDSFTLHATVEPANATKKGVEWSSNNTSVATVDSDGKVTASSSRTGEATITVKTQSGGKTATCLVKVVNEVKHVTGVTVTPDNLTLRTGGEKQLSFSLIPSDATNHNVTWSSDKPSVATVTAGGKVKGIADGIALITVKTEDGGHEAVATVKVVQPYTKVTITSPNTSDSHYDASTQKYTFFTNDTFLITAGGEPAGAEDELEFSIYGWGNDNYKNYYNIEPVNGTTCRVRTTAKSYSDMKVKVSSKADPSVFALFTFNTANAPADISLSPIRSECSVYVPSSSIRKTECIGVGTTQKFTVTVLDSDGKEGLTPQSVTIVSTDSDDGVHPTTASISDRTLTVTIPANAATSTSRNTYTSRIKLRAVNGLQKEFTFKTTLYDPYSIKPGDGLRKNGDVYDGGYRGNGIFDSQTVGEPKEISCVIVYLGDEHTTEDPFWNALRPSTGVKDAKGNAVHGIAIPVNIDYLTRKDEPSGEYYYTDGSDNNFILDSSNLPSWLNSNDRKNLLRSTSLKHSAGMNTCCHVYCNAGRGASNEIIPFNYFIDTYTKEPSKNESGSMEDKKYSFCTNFSYDGGKLSASEPYVGNVPGMYMTTWLMPTIADITSIFCGRVMNREGADTQDFVINGVGTPDLTERFNMIRHCTAYFNGGNVWVNSYNWKWWLANETGNNKACQAILWEEGNNANLSISKNVPHKNNSQKAFVLPIRYF